MHFRGHGLHQSTGTISRKGSAKNQGWSAARKELGVPLPIEKRLSLPTAFGNRKRMSRDEILKRYPNSSESFLRANVSTDVAGTVTKLERNPCNGALEAQEVQGQTGERILVRITSFRRRLLDEDNQCEKYHVDLCRYAGVIPCDTPGEVQIEVRQRKAHKAAREETLVEVFKK